MLLPPPLTDVSDVCSVYNRDGLMTEPVDCAPDSGRPGWAAVVPMWERGD